MFGIDDRLLDEAIEAAREGDLAKVQRYVEKNRRLLTQRTEFKSTLLHNAGSAEIVRFLIEAGMDVDVRGWMNASPLYDAVSGAEPKVDVASALLDAGADPNLLRDQGYVPLHFVNSVEVAELLLARGADLEQANRNDRLVERMVLDDKPTLLDFFLSRGAALSPTGSALFGGSGPLHHAIAPDRMPLIEVLLAHDAPVDGTNYQGETPLMRAASIGLVAVIRRLLAAGADVQVRDVNGRRAIDIARARGHAEVVAVLKAAQGATRPEPVKHVDDVEIVWCIPDHVRPRVWAWTRQGWLLRLELEGDEPSIGAASTPSEAPQAAVLAGDNADTLELWFSDKVWRLDAVSLERIEEADVIDSRWTPPVVGSVDGRWTAWGRGHEEIGVYDHRSQTLRSVEGGERHHDLEIDPTGRWVAVPASFQGGAQLSIYGLPPKEDEDRPRFEISRADHRSRRRDFVDTLASVAFSPQGDRIACFETSAIYHDRKPKGWLGNIFIYDLVAERMVAERPVLGEQQSIGVGYFTKLAFTDERLWYVSDDGSVRGLDPATLDDLDVLRTSEAGSAHRVFAWGDRVWVLSAWGSICRATRT